VVLINVKDQIESVDGIEWKVNVGERMRMYGRIDVEYCVREIDGIKLERIV
jgi:hypothetical protein